jgi:hypothetical protein
MFKFPFVSRWKHEEIVDDLRERIATQCMIRDACAVVARNFEMERDQARTELAALKTVRARCTANLTAANARRAAEAKRKRAAQNVLPEGLIEQDGRALFECKSCGEWTEWYGDVSDFDVSASENRCGGSPRCIP